MIKTLENICRSLKASVRDALRNKLHHAVMIFVIASSIFISTISPASHVS